MITFKIPRRRCLSMPDDAFAAYRHDQHASLSRRLFKMPKQARRHGQGQVANAPVPESYVNTIRPEEAKFPGLHACQFALSNETMVMS